MAKGKGSGGGTASRKGKKWAVSPMARPKPFKADILQTILQGLLLLKMQLSRLVALWFKTHTHTRGPATHAFCYESEID